MNLQESIRRILKEEVNKKYQKPSDRLNKLIYSWLNQYFAGSQIYKIESWKFYSYRFEFCKNGREIADLHVRFDDKSPAFGPRDKRPTSERSVEMVTLFIYPLMVNMMLKVFPIRRNYLIYIIEEWFEDTFLNKVQDMLGRNDLSLYELEISSRKEGDTCVPPMTKPEDVTMQDMMDYIKKNTLFSYKDMEKYEEEEPGWIEDMYLENLRQKEQERLQSSDEDEGILREDKKTKSTNKEFSKYKDSKFNSLRDYTLKDIVDNWDSLSDHKNENIKTIKHFINNPDKITDLVYDEKGLEDGYHRLIAAKILKKPRFSYRLVENLQESIRKILREETEPILNDLGEKYYISWNENYGKSFKVVKTPDGAQSGGEWNPNLVSIVTPENTNAWDEWEELSRKKLNMWRKNWDDIQKTLGNHKYNQIVRNM